MQDIEDKHSGRFWIDDFNIDPNGLVMRGPMGEIALEPKVMQVLVTLADKPGQIISRDEFIDKIWAVEYGGDESLTRAISILRKNFGDTHGRRTIIKTVPRKGYTLIGMLSKNRPAHQSEDSTVDLTLPAKPTIAVMPFINMSDDKDTEHFADGMTEDIITGLSLSKHLSVKSRTSSFAYKGISPDIRDAARELGVRYIVEGSVRQMGKRIRITAQLIEASNGNHIWAKKYDRASADLFDIQDEVLANITMALDVHMTRAEVQRARNLKPSELDGWETLQQFPIFSHHKKIHVEIPHTIEKILSLLELKPDYAYAHATLAWIFSGLITNGWSNAPSSDYAAFKHHLEKALSLAPDDPYSLLLCANGLGGNGETDRAHSLCLHALNINPNYIDICLPLGQTYALNGEFDKADEAFDHLINDAPSSSYAPWALWYKAQSRLYANRNADAESILSLVVERLPGYDCGFITLALARDMLGDHIGAAKAIRKAVQIHPEIISRPIPISVKYHPDPAKSQQRVNIVSRLFAQATP